MGKDSLSKRIAKEERAPVPVSKKPRRESPVKKALSKIRKAVTEERRRKGFI